MAQVRLSRDTSAHAVIADLGLLAPLRLSHDYACQNRIDFFLAGNESKDSVLTQRRKNKKRASKKERIPSCMVQIEQPEEEPETEQDLENYRFYGTLLLVGLILYLVLGLGAIFNLWDYLYDVTCARLGRKVPSHDTYPNDFPVEHYFVYVILLCPTIFWVWCIVSWVGMKLFRHAKGIANV